MSPVPLHPRTVALKATFALVPTCLGVLFTGRSSWCSMARLFEGGDAMRFMQMVVGVGVELGKGKLGAASSGTDDAARSTRAPVGGVTSSTVAIPARIQSTPAPLRLVEPH